MTGLFAKGDVDVDAAHFSIIIKQLSLIKSYLI
jgi:hypothetical protein